MSGRELVILLLGLAIVAVVLRGLYVALNARRGQIKLAIDKNIPQNVDLEALELAELPGGGARVVTRSLEEVNRQNSALDKAESRARAIDLADAEDESHIPVLMDAVELSEGAESASATQPQEESRPRQESPQREQPGGFESAASTFETQGDGASAETAEQAVEAEQVDEEEFTSYLNPSPDIGTDWEEDEEIGDEPADGRQQPLEAATEEDADAVLFDYEPEEYPQDDNEQDQQGGLSSVAPDYDDEDVAGIDEAAVVSDELPNDQSYEEADSVDDLGDDGWRDEERQAGQEAQYEENHKENYEENYEGSREEGYEENQEANYRENFEENSEEGQDAEYDEDRTQRPAAGAQAQHEEEPQPFDADDDVDAFSMTAGERIGGAAPKTGEARQTSLFDEDDDEETEQPKKGRSLFSMFGRKSSKRHQRSEVDEPVQEQATEPAPVPEDYEAEALSTEAPQPAAAEPIQHEATPDAERVDELDQKRAASAEQELEAPQNANDEGFEHSEVLVLNVTAKDGRVFAGDDLLHILITSGLKFGDMNIFHKRLSKDNQGSVIFSVANMLNPGTFDLNNMDEFTTLGISFFLALPTPINNLDAFEQMLAVAQSIRDALGGDLKDDHRNGMTAQTIEHYRQRVRDFELRRLKAVAARG